MFMKKIGKMLAITLAITLILNAIVLVGQAGLIGMKPSIQQTPTVSLTAEPTNKTTCEVTVVTVSEPDILWFNVTLVLLNLTNGTQMTPPDKPNGTISPGDIITINNLAEDIEYRLILVYIPTNGTMGAVVWMQSYSGSPDVVYVDDDFNENTSGWGYDHFDNIQDGVDAVDNNGTVNVYSGVYDEVVVIDKTLDLIGEAAYNTVATNISILANGVSISGFNISGGLERALAVYSDNNNIYNNYIVSNSLCVFLWCSNSNNIHDNVIMNVGLIDSMGILAGYSTYNTIKDNYFSNLSLALELHSDSDNNIIDDNSFRNNKNGILIFSSDHNIIKNNSLRYGQNGIKLFFSHNNKIYHNNIFSHNGQVSYDDEIDNQWDDGYPSAGNYWENYTGVDNFHGPNQDKPGSDGIGDTPYNIQGSNNTDRYPVMEINGWINYYPPSAPSITGETNGQTGEEYVYTFVSSDPEDYPVYYYIDWGDGTNASWIGVYDSGEPINVSHTFEEDGNYTISAKAKDTRGAESGWGYLSVTMPVNEQSLEQHVQQSTPQKLILRGLLTKN